jgi:hypothetical protein
VLQREASSAVAIYCFGPQKTAFISNLIDRTVIDITQLRCPHFANIRFATISCTFACHNKLKHACALQSAYSIAQWLHFHILSHQYTNCPLQPTYPSCFPDVDVTRTYTVPQQAEEKHVSIFLDVTLQLLVKIASSSHSVVRNQTVVHSSDIQET